MPHVRRNVWKLPATDKTLDWYGKAVEALQKLPITNATSWWSLGAMHGFDKDIWRGLGFIKSTTALPPSDIQEILWRQCQHQTWYFLPWHRGYLGAFEAIIRDAVKKLGGPADWTLPYWDYSDDAAARELPRAFAKAKLPDGSKNFLHVPQRYGTGRPPNVQSPLVIDRRVVGVTKTLQERFFKGSGHGGTAGFGGIKTPFHHGDDAGTFGVLESQPHGGVHVAVGGGESSSDPLKWGLMTNPDTAALDPLFWLHHANIDRLWNVWLRQKRHPGDPPDAFKNPTDADWLDGPRDQEYSMPRLDGTFYKFTARDVLDTKAPMLDYIYDDEAAPAAPADHLAMRLERLGASPERAMEFAGAVPVAPPKPAELLGANQGALRLNEDVVETRVRLDSGQRQKLSAGLQGMALGAAPAGAPAAAPAGAPPGAPDRVFLNLENIKSHSDAGLFYVYVDLPQGADPEQYPDHLAGTISMFGVSKATASQGPGAGNGVNASLDITSIVDKLHLNNALGEDLSVKLVSAVPGATSDNISIGRISVYRQAH